VAIRITTCLSGIGVRALADSYPDSGSKAGGIAGRLNLSAGTGIKLTKVHWAWIGGLVVALAFLSVSATALGAATSLSLALLICVLWNLLLIGARRLRR